MGILSLQISNFRSFGLTPIRIPEDTATTFSPGINLLVGPNGSGKTTILNALGLAFGRGQGTTQGNPILDLTSNSASEHHKPEVGWQISAHFDYGTPELKGFVTLSRHVGKEPIRRLNGTAKPFDVDKDATLQKLYDRCFPVGWPRQMWKLGQRSFKSREGSNQENYKEVWKAIQESTLKELETELCEQHEISQTRKIACPLCGGEPTKDVIGDHFRDKHGAPLAEASDGQAHFVYLILELKKHRDPTTFLIEEPDAFMHPGLQKQFLDYLRPFCQDPGHQFFISTHSPYMLDLASRWAIREKVPVHVYRLTYENGTQVEEKHPSDAWEVLLDLGHRPSDVMHPNGVIWVEGPSDVIYLDLWLQQWVSENTTTKLMRGLDYEILPFGGATAAHIEFVNYFSGEDASRLINLLAIHPSGGVLIDRDRDSRDRMRKHKEHVISAFRKRGSPAHLTGPRCIEGYISSAIRRKCNIPVRLNSIKLKKWNKVQSAIKYERIARGWCLRRMVETTSDIRDLLRSYYEAIEGWRSR